MRASVSRAKGVTRGEGPGTRKTEKVSNRGRKPNRRKNRFSGKIQKKVQARERERESGRERGEREREGGERKEENHIEKEVKKGQTSNRERNPKDRPTNTSGSKEETKDERAGKPRDEEKRWKGLVAVVPEPPSEDRAAVVRRSSFVVRRGARGMMNIKAGQAVRVDSTLSARGAKKELSDQYFLCENLEAEGVEADYGVAGSDEHGARHAAAVLILLPPARAPPRGGSPPRRPWTAHRHPPPRHPFLRRSSLGPSFLSPRAGVIRNIIKLSASSFARVFVPRPAPPAAHPPRSPPLAAPSQRARREQAPSLLRRGVHKNKRARKKSGTQS